MPIERMHQKAGLYQIPHCGTCDYFERRNISPIRFGCGRADRWLGDSGMEWDADWLACSLWLLRRGLR